MPKRSAEEKVACTDFIFLERRWSRQAISWRGFGVLVDGSEARRVIASTGVPDLRGCHVFDHHLEAWRATHSEDFNLHRSRKQLPLFQHSSTF